MAKANEKDAYYFSHDCNARNDPKILALRSVYGAEGYGIYFMLIEILRDQPDYKLQVTKYLYNTLAMQMQCPCTTVENIVHDCCSEFVDKGKPLLVDDGQFIYSESLLRRMELMDSVSETRRAAANKRWEKRPCKDLYNAPAFDNDANDMQEQSKCTLKERKINEKKGNETKGKENIFAAYAGDDMDMLSALQGFEEMRVKIKKPLTDRARKLMLTELEKLSMDRKAQIAILDQSVKRAWAGVFALKDDGAYSSRSGRQQATGSDKMDALRDLHNAFSGGDGQ